MLMYKLVKLHTNSMLKPLRKENIKGFSKKKKRVLKSSSNLSCKKKQVLEFKDFLWKPSPPFKLH